MRLVVNPEKMVIKEAQRTYTSLNLYSYVTDVVVCNRVMPDTAQGSYFEAWLTSQRKYLQMVEEAFAPLPIMTAPYFEQEVAGIPMLKRLAAALFGERDPAQIFFEGQAYRIEKNADGYVLAVPLPFVDREDVSLLRKESELTLQVGARRRTFALPRVLAGRETRGAGFVEHELHIRFS